MVLSFLFLYGQVTSDVILLVASKIGHKEMVHYLLRGQIASRSYQRAFEIACAAGHAETAALLLHEGGIHPEVHENIALRLASAYGHEEVVAILLRCPKVNPADRDNEALIYACSGGHEKVVQLLIGDKRVSPEAQDNLAIECASYNGHIGIVGLLLRDSRVCPSANRALLVAKKNGHYELAELIMSAVQSTKK
jgi:ankyrin repeat protein